MEGLDTFENWFALTRLRVEDLPHYGNISGVYAMRLMTTGEILYIGSSNNLRRRIFGNYIGRVGGETTQRVHHLVFSEGQVAKVELAWVEVDEYADKEAALKEEYRQKHDRLPKWNKL